MSSLPALWHAMRVTYRRELQVKQMIDDLGIDDVDTYVPLRRVSKVTRRGVKTVVNEPAVHNLLFVRARREWLQEFKSRVPHLQYLTMRSGGRSVPIVVPDGQMDAFIALSRSAGDNAVYFAPGELDLRRGTRVRLHGGLLDGVQATYVKLAGRRNRQIVVEIDGVVSIATATVSPDYIEVIEPSKSQNSNSLS